MLGGKNVDLDKVAADPEELDRILKVAIGPDIQLERVRLISIWQ